MDMGGRGSCATFSEDMKFIRMVVNDGAGRVVGNGLVGGRLED